MTVKLYGTYLGPTKHVEMVLREKGVPYEFHMLNLGSKEHKVPEYMAKQPFGQVPCLVSALWEPSSEYPRNGVVVHLNLA
jgi:glutathione S-transferase